MKKIFNILLTGTMGYFILSCTDTDKDPLQFEKITNGALLTLRGAAYENVQEISYSGSIEKFSVSGSDSTASNSVSFECDFVAKDIKSLESVITYVQFKDSTRVKILETPSSAFQIPSGGRYPHATITLSLSNILQALNLPKSKFNPERFDYIGITSDIVVNGKTILASSIINSSLLESSHFYPAHNLRYLAVK